MRHNRQQYVRGELCCGDGDRAFFVFRPDANALIVGLKNPGFLLLEPQERIK